MSTARKSGADALRGGHGRAHDPTGRARAQQRHGAAHDVVGRHHAAGRLDDLDRAGVARGPQPFDEPARVGGDPRCHVGVDERRAGALELRSGREDLVRQRHVLDVGVLVEDQLARAQLVGRVDVGEEVQDRDRAHAELPEPSHAAPDGLLVEGQQHRTGVVDPLGDRDAGPPTSDGDGRRVRRVPDRLLVDPPQFDLVAMALGDQQSGGGAVHLDHGVVGDRRPVDDDLEAAEERRHVEPEPLGDAGDAVHHTDRLVLERGRDLVEQQLGVGRHADDVGEGPADIHRDPHRSLRRCPAAPLTRHARPARCPGAASCRCHERVPGASRRDARSSAVAASSTANDRSSSEPVSTTP